MLAGDNDVNISHESPDLFAHGRLYITRHPGGLEDNEWIGPLTLCWLQIMSSEIGNNYTTIGIAPTISAKLVLEH
jgi:hypothetical protein